MDAIPAQSDAIWELMWAPYDQPTYELVLRTIRAEDEVLEIGAGDLRLAVQIARIAKWVVAIEIHPEIIERGLSNAPQGIPGNLTILPGDARLLPFPPG
ncbi:MAG TPA: rRNA adenine N-6-methyltransferase family protein, partial [Anaerolineaceae bacterium]|nr:rRNA adenine N-6-methyltransferase family protein [Anaerolineaceae bacterium]